MASTSLAQQLQKLATPYSKLYVSKNKKVSLLFDASEAASIDRTSFHEIGVSGLNELIEINNLFEEFRNTLFDDSSKNFERAVQSSEVNEKLNQIIKRFLYLLSPYFLLKPTQKVLEWLIARFHIQDFNSDELICMALPYHGTRLFARLLQVIDLKNEQSKWHWLFSLQRKGVPLSKNALFNHCASDAAFFRMICNFIVDCVQIFGENASKLSTLFAFYSTTVVGTLQNMSDISELHLMYLLPSIWKGLSSDIIDFISSVLIIIAFILTKSSFEKRMHKKLVEKITKIDNPVLHKSVVLSLNILYQNEDIEQTTISKEALKNLLSNSVWFLPTLGEFLSSNDVSDVFYLTLIRYSLRYAVSESEENADMVTFIQNLLKVASLSERTAGNLIETVIKECCESEVSWSCELVQRLERQYPVTWDGIISTLLKTHTSGSLSRILGFTSITTQVQIFEKLNHVQPMVRIEAIKWISENAEIVKVKYVESSLISQWDDDDPSVIEAMFMLPENLRYYTPAVCEKLLLKCWHNSSSKWDEVLLKVISTLKIKDEFKAKSTKYIVLLLPFLVCSNNEVRKSILEIDYPFLKAIQANLKNDINEAIHKTLKSKSSDQLKINDLVDLYEELPQENVYIFTLLVLLSTFYTFGSYEYKLKIFSCVFERIFPTCFKKLKWKTDIKWNENDLQNYYKKTTRRIPEEIIFHLIENISAQTCVPEELTSLNWCSFSNPGSNLCCSLYKYLNMNLQLKNSEESNFFMSYFLEKHLTALPKRMSFLFNMCLAYRSNESVLIESFKMINLSLKNTSESFSWTAKIGPNNIVIPNILIHLYSKNACLREIVMETIEIFCASFGLAISEEVTFIEFLKHLKQYKEEIILDREQLPSVIYGFLSQDRDVQELLPSSVRCFTKRIFSALIDCIVSESVPLPVCALSLPALDFLQDKFTIGKLIPLARRILENGDYKNSDGGAIVCMVIEKLNENETDLLNVKEVRGLLDYCVQNYSKIMIHTEEGDVFLGTVLLRKLSNSNIFAVSHVDLQKYLLDWALKVLIECVSLDLVSTANSFMKKIALSGELITPYFEDMKKADLQASVSQEEPKQLEWRVGIALLEITQNKKKISNCQVILPLLFEVLQKCCEVDEQIPMEYAKQLCLSCALNCCQKLTSETSVEDRKMKNCLQKLFKVDMVVNCIRMSPNSQTHHHALMLLAYCASFAPEQVLHNIMAIFTFMGSSVLRQDDAFSFQIISNIMDTIVPLLVRKTNDDEKSVLSLYNVLKVFAYSIPDIPDHRRIPLLVKLMTILNDGEHLHVIVLFALERASKSGVKTVETKYTEAVMELLMAMPAQQTLNCLENVLVYANSFPHNIDGEMVKVAEDELLNVNTFKNKELHHFKYLLMNCTSYVLSKAEFVQRMSTMDSIEMKKMEACFRGMIEQIIMYIKTVSEFSSEGKSTSLKYWKVMTWQATEILNKTNALLTGDAFMTIIKDLINHKCLIVQRKTLELLNWRLQQMKDGIQQVELSADELVTLAPILLKVISSILKTDLADSNDWKLNQQTALISMKLLVKCSYSVTHTAKFKKILFKLSAILSENSKIHDHVVACLILAIAELISSLNVHAIEALPKIVPEILNISKRYHTQEISSNDVLLMSIVVAVQKLVETLSNFLSPYLEAMLFEMTYISAHVQRIENKIPINEDLRSSLVAHKIKAIRQKLAEIPSRVLLPSVSACFDQLCETRNFEAMKSLMDILADSFPQNGHFSSELISLFLRTLDFRCTANDATEENVCLVENTVIDGLSKIVLKCSETTFRPFYHKLYDWGVIASKEHTKKERIITYYQILRCISEKLKSIFVLFAGNFIRNAAELLQKCNVSCNSDESNSLGLSDAKIIVLVDSILQTLFNVFKYDTVKFLTKDRFNMLCEPLVNQVENNIGDYATRCKDVIIPCLARFAATTTDDSLWKQFNYLILLKTRHSLPEVRLAALDTVVAFATYLGDNFLPFLPETVPFLAELLEDENENVEKLTHKAVQKLEEILEEPIQKYF